MRSAFSIDRDNANAAMVHMGKATLCFSYRTLVGVRAPNGRDFKLSPSPSVTTSKHLTGFGLKSAEPVSDEALDSLAKEALANAFA